MHDIENCPVCGSSSLSLRFEGRTTIRPTDPQEWRVDGCSDCGLGFMNPMPTWDELQQYYDTAYGAYDPTHGSIGSDDVEIERALTTGQFRHLPIPRGKKVLDIGTGGGFFLRICSKLGATVQGVEPSPIAADMTRSQGINVFNGKLEDFVTSERFDVITANQVLEHVPDPVETLGRMRDLLAPGGVVWIAVPNAACRWAKSLEWKWDGADLPFHLLQFDPESLQTAGRNAGLSTRRIYTNSIPWIVRYSMQKHLRENYRIPKRISGLFLSDKWASNLGQSLDAQSRGDNLIAEFVAAN